MTTFKELIDLQEEHTKLIHEQSLVETHLLQCLEANSTLPTYAELLAKQSKINEQLAKLLEKRI